MYALVDGNNFFVSCEVCFRPSLRGRPVVVLGSNDGCAIARSNEAKALGIKMGAPWFQIRHLAEEAGLVSLSANFALYGDISDRMMSLAAGLGHTQLVYSIDESFVKLDGIRGDLVERSRKIRSRILQWTGIPCGIGIGRTKTLSKLANHIAKTAERKPGIYPGHLAQVCNLDALSPAELRCVFEATKVDEVWGIGRRIGKQLTDGGIRSVQDLVLMDAATLRRSWSVVLERTVRELQGITCIELDEMPGPKQQIMCSRSFGHPVTELRGLVEAVSEFASSVAVKLRRQHSLASQLLVFIRTSPFRQQDLQYSRSIVVPLRRPTSDTSALVQAAHMGLSAIFRPGYKFAKAGVMLLDLQPDHILQGELDLEAGDADLHKQQEKSQLMAALDSINQRFGRGTMKMASAGLEGDRRVWTVKQELRTPCYTTCVADMPIARA